MISMLYTTFIFFITFGNHFELVFKLGHLSFGTFVPILHVEVNEIHIEYGKYHQPVSD